MDFSKYYIFKPLLYTSLPVIKGCETKMSFISSLFLPFVFVSLLVSWHAADCFSTDKYPAQPVTFKQKLETQDAEEGADVILRCELSKPGVPVEWKKGTQVLKSGEKYQMKQKTSMNELLIIKVVPEDSGDYSCVCGDQKTTASLNIRGRKWIFEESMMFQRKRFEVTFHLQMILFLLFYVLLCLMCFIL